MDGDEVVAALAALAQPTRLSIFRELVKAGDSGLAAGKVAELLGTPASSLSFHLSTLKQGGMVQEKRAGRSIIYSASFGTMQGLVSYLLANCCVNSPANKSDDDEADMPTQTHPMTGEA